MAQISGMGSASTGAAPGAGQMPFRLQPLVLGERGICQETELYVRLVGGAEVSDGGQAIHFPANATATFDTYFNLFSLEKWQRACGLKDVRLVLHGEGKFQLTVTRATSDGIREIVHDSLVEFAGERPEEVVLPELQSFASGGVLFFGLKAIGFARLKAACWTTAQAPLRSPELVLTITTFRREEAIRRSVGRFREFMSASPIRDHLHLIVVDNGRSAGIEDDENVSAFGNENFGGSGGFARGALEARARGATHCVFMDDDAMIHMSTLERIWSFLSYVEDDRTAIVGALTQGAEKWRLWENGATFERTWHRHLGDMDLRDFSEHLKMEDRINLPANFYGGWWLFAFPLKHMTRLPFPFFVRGDDVSFSLAHEFSMVTLPGVVSFQNEDFADKISPLNEYLDLRSRLVHHLSLPKMDIGGLGTVMIAARTIGKTLCLCRYETVEALNMAIEDVMAGPRFFADDPGMARRRADLKALTRIEAYVPSSGSLPDVTSTQHDAGPWMKRIMKLTLNGHVLPFFSLISGRKVLLTSEQGNLDRIWGAGDIVWVDPTARAVQTLSHSKAKAYAQIWRTLCNGIRFLRKYPTLKKDWQNGYETYTSEEYWREKLKLR